MIATTYNAQTVYLVNDPPDWNVSAPACDFTLSRDLQTSLTKREARRPYSASLLCHFKYDATISDAALRAVQGALRSMTVENVVVPFWPSMQQWQNRASAPIGGGLMIAWKDDWSQFTIYSGTDTPPSWPAPADNWAPALMGFLKPTQPRLFTPDTAMWGIDFTESSPAGYALQPAAGSFAAGPQPAGYTAAPKLLPFVPDFTKVQEGLTVDVKGDPAGFIREQSRTFYPHAAMRSQVSTYTFSDTGVATFLSFFQTIAGPGASFWASGYLNQLSLTADALSTDTVLNVVDHTAVAIGDRLAFFNGAQLAVGTVSGVGSGTVTLSAAVGVALSAVQTCVFPLSLARLDKAAVSVKWTDPAIATTDLSWTELPAEELLPGNETLGTTIGKLNQRIVLFRFTRDFGNGTINTWWFTNFEADITWDPGTGSQTWLHANFQCGDVTTSLNLENDSCEIKSFIFAGNPFNDDMALTNEAPLRVTIWFADFDGTTVSNAAVVFTGDVSKLTRQGNNLRAQCKFGPAIFETQLPRMLRGPICNNLGGSNNDGSFLISAGCTLLKADWKFTGLVVSPVSVAYPFQVNLNTLTGVGTGAAAALAAGAVVASFFANGWAEWGAGANLQRRAIIASTLPVMGALQITLHRYFRGVPSLGDTITLYPGCDGLYTTCQAYDSANNPTGKFSNYLNFGAEPFTPGVNPSAVGQFNLGINGAKK